MKIVIAGMGYVGLSLVILLAQLNELRALATAPKKVQLLNQGKKPTADAGVERFLREQSRGIRNLHITATSNE